MEVLCQKGQCKKTRGYHHSSFSTHRPGVQLRRSKPLSLSPSLEQWHRGSAQLEKRAIRIKIIIRIKITISLPKQTDLEEEVGKFKDKGIKKIIEDLGGE